MVQEIIVYLILLYTAVYMLQQSIVFFRPVKALKNGVKCSNGSCSGCSLKIDLDSIRPDIVNFKPKKSI